MWKGGYCVKIPIVEGEMMPHRGTCMRQDLVLFKKPSEASSSQKKTTHQNHINPSAVLNFFPSQPLPTSRTPAIEPLPATALVPVTTFFFGAEQKHLVDCFPSGYLCSIISGGCTTSGTLLLSSVS